ncbi:MAG: biopolymer transporter ExbD [Kiritimatiellae bacterium]|nr:biopolymer transporter ExbD [Kiritimatiellia bacterium]
MARRKERTEPTRLEMTPMIDVVFQLLIFFIVTIKQEDILSRLDVIRPAPDPEARPEDQVQDLLQITVYKDGYVLRGTPVTASQLRHQLKRLAGYSKNISVIIRCTADSQHKLLVELLDMCAEAELTKIAVFSM